MGATTLGAMLRDSATKYADKAAVMVPSNGAFQSISYRDHLEKVRTYAGALRSLGLKRGDRLALMSENCVEWALTDWACHCLGVIMVPIYPTLPADQALYIVQDCGAFVAIAGSEEHAKRMSGDAGVKVVLLKGEPESLDERAAQSTLSAEAFNIEIDSAKPEDIATIIYTSGTTGLPKGACLSNRSLTWIQGAVVNNLPVDDKDTFLSFLPLSHVLERVDGHLLPIAVGATIAYSKNLMTLAKDIQTAKPTVMLCVPRFLENMKDKIIDGIGKQKPIKQKLFHFALAQGTAKFHGKPAPFFALTDRLVGAKIRARVGGKLRFFVAGGAALPMAVAEFYNAFGLKILQGYGLTETSSGIAVSHPDRCKVWTVGEILPGMEAKIAADGEILLRGPAVFDGYHNLPAETSAALDADGWFHTGDIGEFEGTYLRITDRKKDLLVLGNGKNVAPQPIESRLKQSRYIQEAVVLGDGMDHCIALIVPQFDIVRQAIGAEDSLLLSTSPEAKALLKREVDRLNSGVAPFEMVKKFSLLDHGFSIEGGELTPSMKVKRKVIKEKYGSQIVALGG